MKMIGPHKKMGRKLNPARESFREKYKLTRRMMGRIYYENALAAQIFACADDAARRLLLGKSS